MPYHFINECAHPHLKIIKNILIEWTFIKNSLSTSSACSQNSQYLTW